MKPAPLRLQNYFLTELHLQARSNFKSGEPAEWNEKGFCVTPAHRLLPADGDKPRCWETTLEIGHQPAPDDNFPYSFQLKLVALFEEKPAMGAMEPELRERIIKINGSSMLYGAAREIVRAATGRGPYSAVLLPSVSFFEQRQQPASTTPDTGAQQATKAPQRPRSKAAKKSTAD